jgi:hypothetical protein
MEAKLYVLKVLANLRLTRGLETKLFSWRAGQPDHSAAREQQPICSFYSWMNKHVTINSSIQLLEPKP